MGVLLIAMITSPQVTFTNDYDRGDEYNLSDVPGEIHDYFMEEIDDGYWLDAKTNGVNLNLTGFGDYITLGLQFNFTFYMFDMIEEVHVSNFGYMSFIDSNPDWGGADFPSSEFETALCVAPFWEFMTGDYNVYAWSTPDYFVIQYDNMYREMGPDFGTFQAVLYPNGTIDFNYLEILDIDAPTVGLNFGDGVHFNSYPADELDGITNFTLRFQYYAEGPELAVTVNGPMYTLINSSYMYTAFAINLGSTNETDLSFSFYLNDVLVNSTTIVNFGPLHNYTLSYNFTGTEEGLNEFRATIEEVPGEFTYSNNEDSLRIVTSIERNYAIFQNRAPWGTTATTDILSSHGIPYDIYGSSSMGNVDLSGYTRVIISSSQPVAFRQRVYDNLTWFEDFAANGGILEVHAADQSNEQWINGDIPGGFDYVYQSEEIVNIVTPWHQVLNVPHTITDEALDTWYSAIHGHFENVSIDALVVLANNAGDSVFVEFPYGDGHIIATAQTIEWGYECPHARESTSLQTY